MRGCVQYAELLIVEVRLGPLLKTVEFGVHVVKTINEITKKKKEHACLFYQFLILFYFILIIYLLYLYSIQYVMLPFYIRIYDICNIYVFVFIKIYFDFLNTNFSKIL